MKPTSDMYTTLTSVEKAEIRKYGVTVKGMIDAIEDTMIHRNRTPEKIATSMLVNVIQIVGNDPDDMYDAQQDVNRVLFILANYCENMVEAQTILNGADIAFINGDVEVLINILEKARNVMLTVRKETEKA